MKYFCRIFLAALFFFAVPATSSELEGVVFNDGLKRALVQLPAIEGGHVVRVRPG